MRTLQQVLARSTHSQTLVLVFVFNQDDEIVQAVKRMCSGKHFCVTPVCMHDAEQALLDHFMVTSVPMCVFLQHNKWSYIMPHVTETSVKDMVDYLQTKL